MINDDFYEKVKNKLDKDERVYLKLILDGISRLETEVNIRDIKIKKIGRENVLMKELINVIRNSPEISEVVKNICRSHLENVEFEFED